MNMLQKGSPTHIDGYLEMVHVEMHGAPERLYLSAQVLALYVHGQSLQPLGKIPSDGFYPFL